MTHRYCLGFAFMPDYGSVLLVEKTKGLHVGMLNGVGGLNKPGEEPAYAMAREGFEETGYKLSPSQWALGAVIVASNNPFRAPPAWVVYVFRAEIPYLPVPAVEDAGPLHLLSVGALHTTDRKYAPHVRMLVHLLRDQVQYGLDHTPVLRIEEYRDED